MHHVDHSVRPTSRFGSTHRIYPNDTGNNRHNCQTCAIRRVDILSLLMTLLDGLVYGAIAYIVRRVQVLSGVEIMSFQRSSFFNPFDSRTQNHTDVTTLVNTFETYV